MSHLTTNQQLVLKVIRDLNSEAYGAAIQRKISEQSSKGMSLARINAILDRLEQQGQVGSRLVHGTPCRNGAARRLWYIKTSGSRAVYRRPFGAGAEKPA